MKVISNVTLRLKAGSEYTPPEAAIDLPDKVARPLLDQGHVRVFVAPPEPEADEGDESGGGAGKGSGKGGAP